MLGIDGDTFSPGKFAKIDAMPRPPKPKLDPPVEKPLSLQSLTETCLDQQVDGSLLQNAGPDALFDALAAGGFQDHRLDALEVQQMRQHQPSRACSHNSDLRAYFHELKGLGTAGRCSAPTRKA